MQLVLEDLEKLQIMKEVIHTDNAPKAIGPYSQATKLGNLIFTAGQIAIDPNTGDLKTASIEEEVRQIMKNLQAVLEASGSSFEHVLKTTIFLSDLSLFSQVNEIYGSYFPSNPPARSTVEVSSLPKGVNVEIDMIAYSP